MRSVLSTLITPPIQRIKNAIVGRYLYYQDMKQYEQNNNRESFRIRRKIKYIVHS